MLSTVPGVGEKTAWLMIVILRSRQFESAAEVASFLGLSKSGSTHFRQALYFPVMVASRRNPDVHAL